VNGSGGGAFEVSAVNTGLTGAVRIVDSTVDGNGGPGFVADRKSPSLPVLFSNCSMRDVASADAQDAPLLITAGATCVPVHWRGKGCPPGWGCLSPCQHPPPSAVSAAAACGPGPLSHGSHVQVLCQKHPIHDIGGVQFENVDLYDAKQRPFLRASVPGSAVLDIRGNIRVHNAHGCRQSVQANATGVDLHATCRGGLIG